MDRESQHHRGVSDREHHHAGAGFLRAAERPEFDGRPREAGGIGGDQVEAGLVQGLERKRDGSDFEIRSSLLELSASPI